MRKDKIIEILKDFELAINNYTFTSANNPPDLEIFATRIDSLSTEPDVSENDSREAFKTMWDECHFDEKIVNEDHWITWRNAIEWLQSLQPLKDDAQQRCEKALEYYEETYLAGDGGRLQQAFRIAAGLTKE